MGRKPLPETLVLRDILAAAKPGEVILYADIERRIGRDPLAHNTIYNAVEWMEKNRGLVFDLIRGKGVVRLPPDMRPELSAPPAADWVRPDPQEPYPIRLHDAGETVPGAWLGWALIGLSVVAMVLIIAAVL